MSNEEILLRIKSDQGFKRINISINNTFLDLKQKIANELQISLIGIQLNLDQQTGPIILAQDQVKILTLKNLRDGTIIWVKAKQEQKMVPKEPQKSIPISKEDENIQTVKNKCNHGPTGKCLNCIDLTNKSQEKQIGRQNFILQKIVINIYKIVIVFLFLICTIFYLQCLMAVIFTIIFGLLFYSKKWLCQHGPNGVCHNCLKKSGIEDAKHVSFEEFLNKKKINCNHPLDATCINCLAPQQVSYKLKLECKNHAPFPQGMCNKCLPQTCIVKRQEYRHVDFAQFMNPKEVTNFVQPWIKSGFTVQRQGWLYGYYAEDPNYQGGVRCIIEAIYEPPQKGSINDVQLQQDPSRNLVDFIAEALGFERVGWIYTDSNHDCTMDSQSVRKALKYQEEHVVNHPVGCKISNFVTVVLRTNKDLPSEVLPEVYMISDQAQALERDGIFEDSGKRKLLKVRESKDEKDVVPQIMVENKPSLMIDPDFFIVNIASGMPKHNKFSTLKHQDFPIENRPQVQSVNDIKLYLKKFDKEKLWEKYSDFHLLLYLSMILDIDTAMMMAYAIDKEGEISADTDLIIKQICNF